MLVDKLKHCDYSFQEFLLTPLQLGIPNSRMRYYLLAKLKPLKFAQPVTGTIISYIPLSEKISEGFVDVRGKVTEEEGLVDESKTPIDPISKYLEHQINYEDYLVVDRILAKYGTVFDIVKGDSRRSCCFTKGYYHFAQGTGSVLQVQDHVDVRLNYKYCIQ